MSKMVNVANHLGITFEVDDEDYERVNLHNWSYVLDENNNPHLMTGIDGKTWHIGRFILNYTGSDTIDHKDQNILNNQKSNLRIATHTQQNANRRVSRNNKSRFKGVCWHEHSKSWRTFIYVNKEQILLGYSKTKEEAAIVYNEAALRYFGEFARLNKI